mgnify:CR=1 FL=1
MHELHVSKRKFSRSTEKARDNLRLEISSARAHQPNLCVFCEKVCPYFRDTSAHVDFFFATKFCQGSPNFKDAIVLLWGRTIFCQT